LPLRHQRQHVVHPVLHQIQQPADPLFEVAYDQYFHAQDFYQRWRQHHRRLMG
jgi:hypothetical protein